MKRMMIRYKVKAERAAENERYIEAVFGALERERPEGLRYASFKLPDGVSFVHLVSVEAADGVNPLASLAEFKAFTAQITERCEEAPVAVELKQVGGYRLLGQ